MGGNALSKPGLRLPAEDYWRVWGTIEARLRLLYTEVRLVPAYKAKQTFGDMDVLVSEKFCNGAEAADILGAVEEVKNGKVTSLGLPYANGMFQLDLIHCPAEELEFSFVYFGYNDLGNLMGRIAHKMGFKYGHDGLWYVIRDPENPTSVVKEVLVSRDLEKVFAFMGYDYEEWQYGHSYGFYALEDVFKYAADNPWFNKDIYLLQNRNHIARMRDRKRASYTEFLKWCEKPEVKNQWKWDNSKKKTVQSMFLQKAFGVWPAFEDRYKRAMGNYQIHKIARKKFNGQLVMELTGLQGKELGAFIQEFKKAWLYDNHFWHWAFEATQEEINSAVLTKFKSMED